jgi:hypothetical protein
VHGLGEVAVGLPCIVLQRAQERMVERIKIGHPAFRRRSCGVRGELSQIRYVVAPMSERCVIVVHEDL